MKRLFSISCRSNNFTNKTRFQEHIVSRIVMNRDIISLKINIIGFKFLRHLEKYKRSEKKTHFLLRLICLFRGKRDLLNKACRRANARKVSLETLHVGQFTLLIQLQLIKPNYCVTLSHRRSTTVS